MRFHTRLLAFTAILVAVAAPAMAVEHVFSGSYDIQFFVSNFNGSTTTGDGYFPEGLDKDAPTANFFQQRVRLAYTGKASADLKLVTKFEFDYTYWGNSSYGVARNGGGAIGSDEVNMETKHLYLDLNVSGTPVNAKIGMQSVSDAFEGIIFSTDAAGIFLSAPFGKLNTGLGFFRLNDGAKVRGDETNDLFALDASYAIGEGFKVGGAYYLLLDNRGTTDYTLHTLGANVLATFGPAAINGFAVYQMGDSSGADIGAYAFNVGLTSGAGPGTVRAEFLYGSGDDPTDDKITALQTVAWEYGYYSNHLVILGRDEWGMTTDNAIVYDVNNYNQGVMMVSAGYDLPLGAKAVLGATAGAAWINQDNANHAGKLLGTEANLDFTYQLSGNLTAVIRGAYVLLGNYFDGVAAGGDDPANPFDLRALLNYSF